MTKRGTTSAMSDPAEPDGDFVCQKPPLSVVRGQQVNATYTASPIPEFQGNPLIEALPSVFTHADVEEMLSYFPQYNPKQRQLPDEIRLHLVENSRELFIPQGIHYEIHVAVSNMLRRGYVDRNPAAHCASSAQSGKLRAFADASQKRVFLRSRARGLCIVGAGGLGKSTVVERILSFYPQAITHHCYKGQDLVLKQLVWIKLQCPGDGSLRA